jgi:hypothetical protein
MNKIEQQFNNLIPSEFGGEMNEELLKGCVKISKELAVGFANWIEKLYSSQKTSVWSKNGEHSGLFTMDNEQLFDKYIDSLSENTTYDNFFDWWEAFTQLAYSKNMIIKKQADEIRDEYYNKSFSIQDGVNVLTR